LRVHTSVHNENCNLRGFHNHKLTTFLTMSESSNVPLSPCREDFDLNLWLRDLEQYFWANTEFCRAGRFWFQIGVLIILSLVEPETSWNGCFHNFLLTDKWRDRLSKFTKVLLAWSNQCLHTVEKILERAVDKFSVNCAWVNSRTDSWTTITFDSDFMIFAVSKIEVENCQKVGDRSEGI
jgi:hypothetical protein